MVVALAKTAKITTQSALFGRVGLPKICFGHRLTNFAGAFRRALEMAYVEPYGLSQPWSPAASGKMSDGRDPLW
jgi:hypothetical protein